MASLIQQRMAINRQRILGTLYLIVGAVALAAAITELIVSRGTDWASGFFLLVGVFWLISGLVRRSKSKRARRAFEAEYGEDAGRQ